MIRLKDFRCQECGSWNAENMKIRNSNISAFRIPNSTFIYLCLLKTVEDSRDGI